MMTELLPDLKEVNNEIHRNIPPNSMGNWKWMECAWSFDNFPLMALAGTAFGHKFLDVLFHTVLEKRTFDPFIGFGEPLMPNCR
jgi:hypothetical protein